MKINEIIEHITKELNKMNQEEEMSFCISSIWKQGKHIKMDFFIKSKDVKDE